MRVRDGCTSRRDFQLRRAPDIQPDNPVHGFAEGWRQRRLTDDECRQGALAGGSKNGASLRPLSEAACAVNRSSRGDVVFASGEPATAAPGGRWTAWLNRCGRVSAARASVARGGDRRPGMGCRTRAGRIADLGLGLDRQAGDSRRSDALGSALPKFNSTTPSTGRQSQMRLSASPRPALPDP